MRQNRVQISSESAWEDLVGYSRAVRVGNLIEVAGTTAVDGNDVQFPYDPYNQTQYILLKIKQAIEDAGGSITDVVRTRIFVTEIEYWREVGRAHEEVFADIKPVATLVEVNRLIDDQLVVEIEATAIVGESS